jgi:hypothetical protein
MHLYNRSDIENLIIKSLNESHEEQNINDLSNMQFPRLAEHYG